MNDILILICLLGLVILSVPASLGMCVVCGHIMDNWKKWWNKIFTW